MTIEELREIHKLRASDFRDTHAEQFGTSGHGYKIINDEDIITFEFLSVNRAKELTAQDRLPQEVFGWQTQNPR
jgi:hypothetical protein